MKNKTSKKTSQRQTTKKNGMSPIIQMGVVAVIVGAMLVLFYTGKLLQ